MLLSCGGSICGKWRVEIAEIIVLLLLNPRLLEEVGDLRIGGLISFPVASELLTEIRRRLGLCPYN